MILGVVSGDDVLGQIPQWVHEGLDLSHMETGEAITSVADRLVSANVYLGARPITEEELRTAKESLVQSLPGTFASVSAINGAISGLWLQSLPDDYYQRFTKSVTAITADDVLGEPRRGDGGSVLEGP